VSVLVLVVDDEPDVEPIDFTVLRSEIDTRLAQPV
jgi:hypothetical protein